MQPHAGRPPSARLRAGRPSPAMLPASRAAARPLAVAAALALVVAAGAEPSPQEGAAVAWRIVNAEAVEIAWRVRSLQFFGDDACTEPIKAEPGATGEPLASPAAELTGAAFALEPRTPRGWESAEACEPLACHLGFEWRAGAGPAAVRCVLLQQGEDGFHAASVALQTRPAGSAGPWADVTTWRPVEPGRAKLAMECPRERPTVAHGEIGECTVEGKQSQECAVRCEQGFGVVEARARCIHGAWYVPECMEVGSLVRIVAQEPAVIKPYWVVLDAVLYRSPDCSDVIRMEGSSISSGEYVIKYANYHPQNVWDSDASTSWASSGPCAPGSCFFGFRFKRPPPLGSIRCVRVEHPEGEQYHATKAAVEVLGPGGWEEVHDVTVQLLPVAKQEL